MRINFRFPHKKTDRKANYVSAQIRTPEPNSAAKIWLPIVRGHWQMRLSLKKPVLWFRGRWFSRTESVRVPFWYRSSNVLTTTKKSENILSRKMIRFAGRSFSTGVALLRYTLLPSTIPLGYSSRESLYFNRLEEFPVSSELPELWLVSSKAFAFGRSE